MNEGPHIDHLQNAVPTLSRRGLLKQAGLLGLAALGLGSGFGELVPTAGAAGTQLSGSQIPQRSPQRSQKTAGELLTILQSHKGGKEAIEIARRGGARFSFGSNQSNLNLRVPKIPLVPPFSVVLFPGHLQAGQSWVTLREVDVLQDTTFQLKKLSSRPSAIFTIAFPQHGWYLLNIEGAIMPNWGISAEIRQMSGINLPGPVVQTWDYPKITGTQPVVRSFPAVYEYKKGSKRELGFHIQSGTLLFQEVSVEAL
ncbi:MAG: hypothetical protein OEY80_03045 [Nitrospirota bacterium]|jgi:hypothetical protein|nr:hypothetical protein [Nitrospirota bacterium]MDH4359524.1 hypothetical protein [Nitrospirota bacterium]MDH5296631.1 hypothetical protein [Nitrospirota bacterium]MDH5574439.1 hypothetical protein [Nitrospirota bacterium]